MLHKIMPFLICNTCTFTCLYVSFKQSYSCMKRVLKVCHSRAKKMVFIFYRKAIFDYYAKSCSTISKV